MTGIFPGKDLGRFTVISVITRCVAKKPFLIPIIMFVNKIYRHPVHLAPEHVKLVSVRRRPGTTYNLYIRAYAPQPVDKRFHAVYIFPSPLFVA